MKIAHLCAILLLCPAASATAAERGYSVTDFDRVRVDGPYKVTLATNRSPSARVYGSQRAIEGVLVEVQGRTLIVKRNSQNWGGYPGQSAGPVEIRLSTPGLRTAAMNGAGSLAIDTLRGASIDLTVSGSGLISVAALQADRLNVAIVGAGHAELAGKAAIAQILVRGTGGVDGAALSVKNAKIGAEGPVDIKLAATSSANIVANGSGSITVTGNPACTVKSTGSGNVSCGD